VTNRAAVVTGASTGIGYATVRRLAADGWQVWGGVRSDHDSSHIERIDGASSLRIDVTDDEQIETAFGEIADSRGCLGLDLLVVNAGVVVGGPLEYVTPSDWRRQFDVNVVGVASSIRCALPTLRLSNDPRIIIVGSINSRVGVPLLSPYAASKHALVGLSSSLRRELGPTGPRITMIEPGAVRTPLWDKAREASLQIDHDLPMAGRREYGDFVEKAVEHLMGSSTSGLSPDRVAVVIEKCVARRNPPLRRLVGVDARVAAALNAILSEKMFDRLIRRSRSGKY
jgi:NAD(P)-dependent dehydrogenase (short-subunit alcohol dehydrogenase family)